MEYCECFEVRSRSNAVRDILDEVKEFAGEPSKDEFSDIMFGIGRFIGALFGKKYVRVLGDRMHIEKIDMRMNEYGCIRSERAVREGKGCV